MIDQITEALSQLKQEYPITITLSGKKEVEFTVEGIHDSFHVYVISGDCIVGTDCWHEHVGDAKGLINFLHFLFTGAIQIEVKYRGTSPVAHRVWKMQDGEPQVVTWTGSFISPFWKKKSYKKLEYKPVNKALDETSQ